MSALKQMVSSSSKNLLAISYLLKVIRVLMFFCLITIGY
jgi:hypothetical protein